MRSAPQALLFTIHGLRAFGYGQIKLITRMECSTRASQNRMAGSSLLDLQQLFGKDAFAVALQRTRQSGPSYGGAGYGSRTVAEDASSSECEL